MHKDTNNREVKLFDLATNEAGDVGVVTELGWDSASLSTETTIYAVPTFIGVRLVDGVAWYALRPTVIGKMVEEIFALPETIHVEGHDRGVPCQAKVTTLPDGRGMIEVTRNCRVCNFARRSFSSVEERDQLVRLIVERGMDGH
jgi:hypothetical protein